MTLYELFGVDPNADMVKIRKAYKALVREHHPDKGGDPEKFREIQEGLEILSDPDRRARYDKTGRIDKSRVTPSRVKVFIEQTISQIIEAQDPMGYRDDPLTNNFRDQIIQSLLTARKMIKDNKYKTQRKIEKATRMLERFKPMEEWDPVREALKTNIRVLEDELKNSEDAEELSVEVERVMKTYGYEVGPEREGQQRPGPTDGRSRPLYIR